MRKRVFQVIALSLILIQLSSCLIMDSPHYYRHRHWHRQYVPHPYYHNASYR